MVGQGDHRTPGRLGRQQPSALRPGPVSGRSGLFRLRPGRVGGGAALSGRAVAGSRRLCGGPTICISRASSRSMPDEVRLRERQRHNLHELAWQTVPAGHADNARLLHARLRPPSASPSSTDWPDHDQHDVSPGALLLLRVAACLRWRHDVEVRRRRQLARLPRTVSIRRRRRSASAGHVETWRQRREHPLEDPGPGPRAFEPDRVGRSDLRDERDQQPRRRRRSSPASTAKARPPRIARRSSGW